MFDFKIKHSGKNTVATLNTESGIWYTVRFYCGKYRAVQHEPRTFNQNTLDELTRHI